MAANPRIFDKAFYKTQKNHCFISKSDCVAFFSAMEKLLHENVENTDINFRSFIDAVAKQYSHHDYSLACKSFLGSYYGTLAAEKKKAQNPIPQVNKKKAAPESKKEKVSAPLTFPSGQLKFKF